MHLVLAARQRRVVADAGEQRRRHGHDDALGADGDAVGLDDDTVLPVPDRADGRSQVHAVTEVGGQPLGDRLHPADDAAVEDEALVREVREGPGGGGHEDGLQRRERVAGLVSMAPAMNSAIVVHASSSSDCRRSQSPKEIVSSSRARGCAQGSVAPTAATRSSMSSVSRAISLAVESETGNTSPR